MHPSDSHTILVNYEIMLSYKGQIQLAKARSLLPTFMPPALDNDTARDTDKNKDMDRKPSAKVDHNSSFEQNKT